MKTLLTVFQGTTFEFFSTVSDGEGAPLDLTGCTGTFLISPGEGAVVTYADATVTVNEDGEVRVNIPAEDTDGFTFTRGFYTLDVEFTDNTVTRILYGDILLEKEA